MNRQPGAKSWRQPLMRMSIIILLVGLLWATIHRLRHHASLSVSPATYSECRGPEIVAHIKWDMRGTAAGQHVFISAYQVGTQSKVYGSGPLMGEIDTGAWVSDGTTITLTDAKNRLLAERTVESTDCAATPLWPQSP